MSQDSTSEKISYDDVYISDKELSKMKQNLDDAPNEKKYAYSRTLLYYGNLARWQKQGFHYLYSNHNSGAHCTCGLILSLPDSPVEDSGDVTEAAIFINEKVAKKVAKWKLTRLAMVKGHRNIPQVKEPTVALIVQFEYNKSIGDYLWDAYCQECGAQVERVSSETAKGFVQEHNRDAAAGGCAPGVMSVAEGSV